MTDTKVMAFYLPQYHVTEYNSKWWGEGFTDWVSVKKATSLYKGHNQPRVPLDDNYYDLSEESADTMKWQASIAKEHGVYGFCIYHYWFAGAKYLDKPVDILLKHPEIEINFSLCWDSGTWKRNWYVNKYESEILVKQDYGDRDMWVRHFNDLLPAFKDERYIKIDNKPVFHIYKASIIPCLKEMRECFDELAREQGFNGIYLVVSDITPREELEEVVDAFYNYQPVYSYQMGSKDLQVIMTVVSGMIKKKLNSLFKTEFIPDLRSAGMMYRLMSKQDKYQIGKTYYGIIPDYDDSPRRQRTGAIIKNNKPEYFKNTLRTLLAKSKANGNEFLYVTAWNEWSESAYLEPDAVNGYTYLDIIKECQE